MTRSFRSALVFALAVLPLLAAGQASAETPRGGTLVAAEACPALQSIRRANNPGNVRLQAGRSYEVVAANAEPPTHLLVRVPGASPERRWVSVACDASAPGRAATPRPRDEAPASTAPSRPGTQYVLAATWHPAFCEANPRRPECAVQPRGAGFSLHGLWPQPLDTVYCRVPARIMATDEAGRWSELAPVVLDPRTRRALDAAMPGARSQLDRHQWIKHGTCHGGTADAYFGESLRLLAQLNASPVRDLFEANTGRMLSVATVRQAFDAAFGRGAGSRVTLSCLTDRSNGRRLIGEIRISLAGAPDDGSLARRIVAAPSVRPAGCSGGIVDAAGFQ